MKNFVVSFFTSLVISVAVVAAYHYVVIPSIEKQKMVQVPDLNNVSVDQAKTTLQSSNLVVAVTEVVSDQLPPGTIIKQDPFPGTSVSKQSTVNLTVSKASENVAIPNMVGMSLNEAKNILIAAKLTLGEVSQISSSSSPGKVLESNPSAMTVVPLGTTVNFKVSVAIEKVTVPDVLEKTIAEATNILRSAGLNVGKITNKTDIDKDFEIIIDQIPKAGSRANKGSAVELIKNTESQ